MSFENQDPYTALGVEKNSTFSQIKNAFRKLARKWHPDVNSSSDAKEKFQTINWAYEILSDDEKRRIWDTRGLEGGSLGTLARMRYKQYLRPDEYDLYKKTMNIWLWSKKEPSDAQEGLQWRVMYKKSQNRSSNPALIRIYEIKLQDKWINIHDSDDHLNLSFHEKWVMHVMAELVRRTEALSYAVYEITQRRSEGETQKEDLAKISFLQDELSSFLLSPEYFQCRKYLQGSCGIKDLPTQDYEISSAIPIFEGDDYKESQEELNRLIKEGYLSKDAPMARNHVRPNDNELRPPDDLPLINTKEGRIIWGDEGGEGREGTGSRIKWG